MLHLSTQSVQSIAPGILKWKREYVRQPAGAPQGKGGEFAPVAQPTHALRAEVEQLQKALVDTALAVPAVKILTGHSPEHPMAVAASPFYGFGKAEDPTTFTREVRSLVKQQIQKDLAERLRKDPAWVAWHAYQAQFSKPGILATTGDPAADDVQYMLDLWAETSGDNEPSAIEMQEAVQQEFDLPKEGLQHFSESVPPSASANLRRARDRAYVRAEYERTQEWFKARGITHVSLFRGMGNSHADVELGFTNVLMQPASSWATSLEIAALFAEMRENPILLTTRVPVEQVLSTAVTGRGCLTETEIILLGRGDQRVRVFDLSDDRGTDRSESYVEFKKRKIKRITDSLA